MVSVALCFIDVVVMVSVLASSVVDCGSSVV